ncbi:hypothetical protein BUALT_Bualt10G0033900 [Buddleja alternifolia]|uniref:Uncharacterized protein n=1 Tax=Buddleja alternifolia TaxID=168488 RepID=A0AAV6X2Z3_9LAMI|nr:hypothetical protein BUALT_Bualt10G0033900 [Buddleja alternifolia]
MERQANMGQNMCYSKTMMNLSYLLNMMAIMPTTSQRMHSSLSLPPTFLRRTSILVENLFEHLKEQGGEIKKLKGQKEESEERLANIEAEYEDIVQSRQEAYEKAKLEIYKNFLNSKEGKTILNDYWESRKAEFLKSIEFKNTLVKKAVIYYSHGFWTCAKQFGVQGYPPPGMSSNFLDEEAGLDDAPDPDEEEA